MDLSHAPPMKQPEIALHYRLFLSDMVSEIRLYFFNGIAYNEASDKSEFIAI